MLQTALTGLLLGWSIAWPPGPINAEMIRRALSRGFMSAWAVGLGASTGDFVWALGIALAAGRISRNPRIELALGVVSIALLLFLAWTFLHGAFRAWIAYRRSEPPVEPKRLQGAGGGWLLGLTLALTSPWNIAFWLGMFGQQGAAKDLGLSMVLAGGVVVGACLWGLVLCACLRLGARFATPMWQVTTQGLTGILMLCFVVRAALRLAENSP